MKKLIYGAALLALAGMSACAPKNTKNEANAPLPLPDAAYDSTYVKEVSEAADEQIVVTETPTPVRQSFPSKPTERDSFDFYTTRGCIAYGSAPRIILLTNRL